MSLANQYLDERFVTTIVDYPRLPFFHSCEAIYLQKILDDLELKPRYCKEYEEDLLYSFYGKPAYKPGHSINSRLTFLMPLCFIINHDAISTIKRLVAFDSGAFKMYSPYLHTSMSRKEFELTPLKESLYKMVNFFYENSDAYFNGRAKKDVVYDPIHSQLEGYHSLLISDHQTDIDDRKTTIEVQMNQPIPINSTTIDAIILPKNLAESPTVKGILSDDLKIPLITITNYGVMAKNYYTDMMEKTKEFLIGKKLLNG